MLSGRIDGVSADDDLASATLGAIRQLPGLSDGLPADAHPESRARLASRRLVAETGLAAAQIAKDTQERGN